MNAGAGMAYNVHPVIRVVCFVIFALSLALGPPIQVLSGVVMVGALYVFSGIRSIAQAWPMLRRMRWFLLSILFIYLFISPSEADFAGGQSEWWMPSWSGALNAGHRILALVLMILAVHWLLQHTSRAALVSALYRLVWPLTLLGLSRERFAVRMMLVFEVMEPVQKQVSLRVAQTKVKGKDLKGYAGVAAELTCDVIALSEKSACGAIDIDISDNPPLLQWGWVILLSVVVLVLGVVV
ncbi:hypothetical protein ACFL2V_20070 [Pseudomonadota bacterium]